MAQAKYCSSFTCHVRTMLSRQWQQQGEFQHVSDDGDHDSTIWLGLDGTVEWDGHFNRFPGTNGYPLAMLDIV